MELPEEFCTEMRLLLGAEYPAFLEAMEKKPVRALRILKGRMDPARLQALFPGRLAPVSYEKNAFYFEADGIGNSYLHHGGAIYIQEPGAMAPVAAVEIPEDARILDVCAAPGGKSIQAVSRLGRGGVIVSNEAMPARCQVLLQNLERCGIASSLVTQTDGRAIDSLFAPVFDLVLVDAPCSGEGMMRKNQDARAEWNPGEVKACAARAREILSAAAKTVASGGTLLFSTCTYNLEENECNVEWFLSQHPEFSLIPAKEAVQRVTAPGIIPEGGHPSLALCRRFYPHLSSGEGQFFAILKKSGERSRAEFAPRKAETKKKNPDREAVLSFLGEVLASKPEGSISEEKDGFYLVPDFPAPARNLLSPGVKIGAVQKGRVIPHHRFFMAFGRDFIRKIELCSGDGRIAKYLHGETFPFEGENGWYAVTADGCVLGGAKVADKTAKNFYPKGLRTK